MLMDNLVKEKGLFVIGLWVLSGGYVIFGLR